MTLPTMDTHSHIDWLENPGAAFEKARRAGIGRIVGLGVSLDSNRKVLELADRYPDYIYPALGLHPWWVTPEYQSCLEFIRDHIAEAVALGEVGLDYRVKVDKALQREVLEKLLLLAAEHQKPVLLHARYSQQRCLDMLKSFGIPKAVFHWYSGPLDILDRVLDAGYFVSATPALAYSPPHREALAHAPLDRILVETDSPEEYQGVRSEPADLIETIRRLAELRNIPAEIASDATTANAAAFFDWPDYGASE